MANIGSEKYDQRYHPETSQKVNALLARDDVDGVVITMALHTPGCSAYFLIWTVKSDKPVVFTAAMRPAFGNHAEAQQPAGSGHGGC